MRAAAEHGAAWVEFDVRPTADGQLVLMHDQTVERTTDGSGRLVDMSLADVSRLDAGAWFGAQFTGERVPTLQAAIDFLAERQLGVNVEIKPTPGREKETGRAAALVMSARWPPHLPTPLLSSEDERILSAVAEVAPRLPRALVLESLPADWPQRAVALGVSGLHVAHEQLDRETIERITAHGLWACAFTVNSPDRARALFEAGVTAVFSDDPGWIAGSAVPAA